MFEVDVIVPVYKPTEKLLALLDGLMQQTLTVQRIILINTEKQYFDKFIQGRDFQNRYKKVSVYHIKKEEFDHGGTRNYGASLSKAPYFVMMTDDAVPKDAQMVEHLMSHFENPRLGMAYARQLPDSACSVLERYARSFNYPQTSRIKSAENLKDMGIKAFFASNVCAAYRRDIFEELGGFTDHTIFNEDMIYARGLIDAGYLIAYEANARVEHSHNYSGLEQFHRYFDLGVSHAQYPQIFSGVATESEGARMVKTACPYLLRTGKPWLIIKLFWQSGCKYIGYFMGKRYKRLPINLVKAFSMHKEYWK
ncbi:glycosyltransferase [bacterium 1xD42-62]|uniref:Glycosyltransferase n=2 Tax=Parablautia muri TaxID=2320879 RepID=A0A9X5BEE8_9FIRM|nr:glycosyltransferase [Parablautia muri]